MVALAVIGWILAIILAVFLLCILVDESSQKGWDWEINSEIKDLIIKRDKIKQRIRNEK